MKIKLIYFIYRVLALFDKIINKKRSAKIDVSNKFFGTYNFIFVKKNAFS